MTKKDVPDRTAPTVQHLDFHGDQIVTFEHEGVPHVAMRRVVENLGLAWQSQTIKLRDQAEKFSCHDIVTTGSDGKTYAMLAMPASKLPLWLASINPNKIPDVAIREKVELYQAESAIALHDYWTKGVALNRAKLEADEEARERALNELKQLRTSDKQLYRKVTDAIVATSYDYEFERENNPARVTSLFARIQDTFHVAVCGKTSQELVIENADGSKPMAGMIAYVGDPARITFQDLRTGKNYLDANPYRRLANLYEQLFLFAEQHMLRGEHMTLLKWEERLHILLKANGYDTFKLYRTYRVPEADAVARKALKELKERRRLAS